LNEGRLNPATYRPKLMIAGLDEVFRLTESQLKDWNILSICGSATGLPLRFAGRRRVKTLCFDDVEADCPDECLFAATPNHIQDALDFAREIGDEPLLIHCHAGISRSTAIAWIIVWDKLKDGPEAVRQSFGIVRKARPILSPNRHVLRLGIEALAPREKQKQVVGEFADCLAELNYPQLDD
jgi:predicted protein tyrosine phosphatase